MWVTIRQAERDVTDFIRFNRPVQSLTVTYQEGLARVWVAAEAERRFRHGRGWRRWVLGLTMLAVAWVLSKTWQETPPR